MPPGITINEGVHELIGEYHAVMPNALTMDETDMLLAALLMELKAQRISSGETETADIIIEQQRNDYSDGSDDSRGTYHAAELTVDADDWREIDLDFTASEVDIRNIDGGLRVAFADPTGGNNVIEYDDSDSPIAGINVQTDRLWFRAQEGAGEQTFNVEAWV